MDLPQEIKKEFKTILFPNLVCHYFHAVPNFIYGPYIDIKFKDDEDYPVSEYVDNDNNTWLTQSSRPEENQCPCAGDGSYDVYYRRKNPND